MDVQRKNVKRKRWIRRGLYITITLTILVLATLGLSHVEPAAPSVDRRTPGDEIILSDMSQWDEHDKIRLK